MIKKILLLLFVFLTFNIYADISSIPKMLLRHQEKEQENRYLLKLKDQIDIFASEYGKSNPVNFAFIISKNDNIIAKGQSFFASKKAYKNPAKQIEYANEKLIDFDCQIPIASATKQFTAAAILKLQESGKLNINDPISKYFSKDIKKLPEWSKQVTLHHLLSQSSGIAEFHTGIYLNLELSERELEEQLLQFMFLNELKQKPGEKFDYSNSNYALLGFIIEKVSGEKLADFFHKTFFLPLKMQKTYFATLQEARDYQDGKLKNKYPKRYFIHPGAESMDFLPMRVNRMLPPLGDGGVISTMNDLQIWLHALHEGLVISQDSLNLMCKPYFTSNYKKYKMKASYGYAMHIQELHGEIVYSHGCDALGLRGEHSYMKSRKIAIISESNFTLSIPKNLSYNEEEIHNMYKIDLMHFHGALLKKILEIK